MFRKLVLFLFSISMITEFVCFAQADSVVLVNAHWHVDSIDGLALKTVHFTRHEYFKSNQFVAILEIPSQSAHALRLAYEPVRTKTSDIARRHQAVAAINGSFFDMDKHNPVCFLRIDGQDVGENTPGKDTVNRKYYQYGTLLISSDSVCIARTDSSRVWESTLPDSNIMTAGPLLLYHGEKQSVRQDRTFVSNRHNRTAVGIRPDGTILLLVVDGRTKESEGLTINELTKTMKWLGCTDALNMDGGGSTTLYVRDYPYDGIVNHPSDNGRFDHQGERGVANAILVVRNR